VLSAALNAASRVRHASRSPQADRCSRRTIPTRFITHENQASNDSFGAAIARRER